MIPHLIEKLHLREGAYLKRAAVLLFHPDPERFVTGAYIKLGFFRTNDDLLYHNEIHGDLFSQVDQTIDLLLTKYLRGRSRTKACSASKPTLYPRMRYAKRCSTRWCTKNMGGAWRSDQRLRRPYPVLE